MSDSYTEHVAPAPFAPGFNPNNQPSIKVEDLQGLQAPATMAIATPIDMPEVQQSNAINPEQLKKIIEQVKNDAYKQGYLDACKDKCKDGEVEARLQKTSTKPYIKYVKGKLSKKHKKHKSKHSKLSKRVKKLTKRVKKLSKKLKAKTKNRKQSP